LEKFPSGDLGVDEIRSSRRKASKNKEQVKMPVEVL